MAACDFIRLFSAGHPVPHPASICSAQICTVPLLHLCRRRDPKMRAFILLFGFSLLVWGQQRDMLSNLRSDIASRRAPTQMKLSLAKEKKPLIQELSVKTTIISRYAFTAVSCTMSNIYSAGIEGVFQIHFPASAFISNFTMIIAGRVYPSQIKEKKLKEAKERGGQPKKEDQSGAGEGEVETFRAVVVIPGKNRAVFLLTYEELLVRRRGLYEHVTRLRPLQLVNKLSVQVTIVDQSKIMHLEVLPLRNRTPSNDTSTDALGKATPPVSTVIWQNDTFCKISFGPSIIQQRRMSTNGMLGDFVVQYDVERELGIGDLQVLDGHFVHYFAPKDLPVVPKNVVFVIDTSASMRGTKMRQTKEALFTILRDLRPNDHFNLVRFSNRIKVWKPNRLVPVTSDNIRDAKKFVYLTSPSGGTDINTALETGSTLLSSYLSSKGQSHNGVSLVIFVTDGRPTVGEVRPPKILSNARSSVRGEFCVFTIGLGDDVDYRLLERLSLDNCGTMRRIPEEADASAMLKGFYDEIGTPLLSDIRVAYGEDAVEYVTQHSFSNYFNGSEIVIAGKLANQSAESLHVQVTANSSDRSVVLETDVPLQERERELEKRLVEAGLDPTAENYAERLFGFLSVKESLHARLRSQTSQDRVEATKKATNLSLAYNFLTPLTSIAVETPGEQIQGVALGSTSDLSTETAKEDSQSTLDSPEPPGKPLKEPAEKLVRISKTSADGDPHFMVDFPFNKLTMCFNINGEPGQVLRLVSDRKHSGVTVNGKLVGAPAPAGSHKEQRTYFSTITVVVDRPRNSYVEITPHKVIVNGTDQHVLPVNRTITVETEELAVAIVAQSNVTVTIQGNISFLILIHQYRNPAPFQRDHLGFYIAKSNGLSENSHGLLGQFLYQKVGLVQMPLNASVSAQPGGLPKTGQLQLSTKTTQPEKLTKTIVPEVPTKNTTLEVKTKTTESGVPAKIMLIEELPKNTQPDIQTKTPQTTQLINNLQHEAQINTTYPKFPAKYLQPKILIGENLSDKRMLANTLASQHPLKTELPKYLTKTLKLDTVILQDKTSANATQLEGPANSMHDRSSTVTISSVNLRKHVQQNIPTKTKGLHKISTNATEQKISTNTTRSQCPTNTTQRKVLTNTNTTQDKGSKNPMKGKRSTNRIQHSGSIKTTQNKGFKNTMPQEVLSNMTQHSYSTKITQQNVLANDIQNIYSVNTTQHKVLEDAIQHKVQTKTNTTQHKVLTNTNTTQGESFSNTMHSKGYTNRIQHSDSINTTQLKVLTHTSTTKGKGFTNTTQHADTTNTTQPKVLTTTTQSKSLSHTNTTQRKVPINTNTMQQKVLAKTTQQIHSKSITQHKGIEDTTLHKVLTNTSTTKQKALTHTTNTQHKLPVNTNLTQQKVLGKTAQQLYTTNAPPHKVMTNHITTKSKDSTNTTRSKVLRNSSATQSKVLNNTAQSTRRMSAEVSGNATLFLDEHDLMPAGTFTALQIKGRTIAVTKKTRRIYSGTQTVDCWFVKSIATKLIDGQYEDYVVSDLFDTHAEPLGINATKSPLPVVT